MSSINLSNEAIISALNNKSDIDLQNAQLENIVDNETVKINEEGKFASSFSPDNVTITKYFNPSQNETALQVKNVMISNYTYTYSFVKSEKISSIVQFDDSDDYTYASPYASIPGEISVLNVFKVGTKRSGHQYLYQTIYKDYSLEQENPIKQYELNLPEDITTTFGSNYRIDIVDIELYYKSNTEDEYGILFSVVNPDVLSSPLKINLYHAKLTITSNIYNQFDSFSESWSDFELVCTSVNEIDSNTFVLLADLFTDSSGSINIVIFGKDSSSETVSSGLLYTYEDSTWKSSEIKLSDSISLNCYYLRRDDLVKNCKIYSTYSYLDRIFLFVSPYENFIFMGSSTELNKTNIDLYGDNYIFGKFNCQNSAKIEGNNSYFGICGIICFIDSNKNLCVLNISNNNQLNKYIVINSDKYESGIFLNNSIFIAESGISQSIYYDGIVINDILKYTEMGNIDSVVIDQNFIGSGYIFNNPQYSNAPKLILYSDNATPTYASIELYNKLEFQTINPSYKDNLLINSNNEFQLNPVLTDNKSIRKSSYGVLYTEYVPNNFIYTQYPGELDPITLFGYGQWKEITSNKNIQSVLPEGTSIKVWKKIAFN